MASVTTNYGFDVPTSSDLVKNGATQIALLGQDLDTFLFRPLTDNYCINSNVSVWQRGTSIAAAASVVYGADRWAFYRIGLATGATMSRQSSGLTGFQYSMRLQRDSGNANTEQLVALQAFESSASIPLAGKTITYSFYAKAGANFSATSGQISASIISGTGTDQTPNQVRSGSWTSQATALNVSPIITSSWVRYSGTVTLGATVTQIALNLGFAPTGTAGANDWIEVTGIQLEIGSQASPFETAGGGSPQAELAMCQRYYESTLGGTTAVTNMVGAPVMATNTGGNIYRALYIPYKVTKRAVPTVTIYDNAAASGKIMTVSSADLSTTSGVTGTADNIGVDNYRVYWLTTNGGAAWNHVVSAEL